PDPNINLVSQSDSAWEYGVFGAKTEREAALGITSGHSKRSAFEAVFLMCAIAERFVLRSAAPAEVRALDTCDNAPRPGGDLQVAPHPQRPVGLRIDRERPVTHFKHVRFGVRRRGLA